MKFASILLGGVCAAAMAAPAAAQPAQPAPPAPAPATPQAAAPFEGVTVTAAPREEVRARLTAFQAPNIVNVQSAETIAKYPDFNSAEALGRVPGVSLSSDTGEGRFVNIRGLDANLNGATYGGVVLLNTFAGGTSAGGGGRAVEFDTIPTGAIDGIVVSKTLSPDHEAEGLGGSVELTPRQAVNVKRPFADLTLGYGYEPLHGHGGPSNVEVALGARFGLHDGGLDFGRGTSDAAGAGWLSNPRPFSFVLTYSNRSDRRAVDDVEAGYLEGTSPRNAIDGYDLRRYDYHRRRFGYGGEFDFTPNDRHRYYLRADVAGYAESVHRNILQLNSLGDVAAADGSLPVDPRNPNGFLVTTRPRVTLRDEQETHRNQIYVVGGQDQFGEAVLDYHAAYSRATFNLGYDRGAQFQGQAGVPVTYDNLSDRTLPIFTFPTGFNVDDATKYSLSRLTNARQSDRDQERTYAANLLFPLRLFSDQDRVKVGGQARIRDKAIDRATQSFGTLPALSLADASSPAVRFYDDRLTSGPYVDRYVVRSLIGGVGGAFSPALGSYLRAKENVYAGYLQYDMHLRRLEVLAGVRVERTEAAYTGYVNATPASGGDPVLSLLTRPRDYTNVFPTVQARLELTPRLLARATYSTGIARPGFNQVTSAATVNFSDTPVTVTRGAPDLRPTTGDAYDLSLEYLLPQGGVLEVGLFDKEFSDYIITRLQNRITTDPLSQGQVANVATFLNVPDAYARGVEAAYNQRFAFLPGALKGLGLDANVTYVDSRFQEYAANQTPSGNAEFGLLPGTSQLTWNVAGFYEADGVQARLAAQYVGPSLFGISGVTKALDVMQDERLTLDLTTSYALPHGAQLYFNARNLLDTPLRYYEGSPDRPIQREVYDVTYEGGVRLHF